MATAGGETELKPADGDFFTRHWRWVIVGMWLAACALFLFDRWNAIRWFSLGDTDDNLRIAQVRALIAGQDWFDLRQYRLDPPEGADVHWSRLVDLPLAGLILLFKPMFGGRVAEQIAVAVAPLIPMLVALFAMVTAARRLISPKAFAIAAAVLFCAHSARLMWGPLRIDHHGWQLAFLAMALAGIVDPKAARGGALLGLASALSFVVGLEMLVYLGAAGAITVLLWIRHRAEAPRLAAYGASLAGATALGYLVFASYANRAPVCDALSPVWLSAVAGAGALAVGLAFLKLDRPLLRLGAAALGGMILAAALAYAWPHCTTGRLEGISPEANRLWLSHVREAKPIYDHEWRTAWVIAALPIVGLLGYAVMLWRSRREPELMIRWAATAALALLAALLLLWQSRAGPAAQLLAVPGAAALGWLIIPRIQASSRMLVRVFGTVAAFMIISGLAPQYAIKLFPEKKDSRTKPVDQANRRCPTLAALRPVALQPRGNVLTFVDLGPRLIAVTHHTAIAGPYHRNDDDIVTVMQAFRGTPENALRTVQRKRIDYVLICPGYSESTIYRAQARGGFYSQLADGKVPAWLQPIDLGKDSPLRMWRVRR